MVDGRFMSDVARAAESAADATCVLCLLANEKHLLVLSNLQATGECEPTRRAEPWG
jgi:hypothetical protein